MKWTHEEIDGKHGVFEGSLLVANVHIPTEYAKEFAKKIITAVNAHDDLVAALRSMLADVEAYQSNPHGHRPINYIAVARAALALAGKVGE